MPNRSLQILLGLVAIAITLSGWIFAWQWKSDAADWRNAAADYQKQLEGTAFTREEQILIDLQDQLGVARKEIDRLTTALRQQKDPEAEAAPNADE